MHAQVRRARFSLIIIGVAALLVVGSYLVALNYLGPKKASGAIGFLGLAGLLGFGSLFYRKKRGQQEVVMDERDTQIRDRSRLGAAMLVLFGFWGVVCMGPWFWIASRYGAGSNEIFTIGIPVYWLPSLFIGSVIAFEAVWSASILVHYRFWGSDDEA